MGINGDMSNRTIGGNDVVVEGTDLVFLAKLLADVFASWLTEDTDGLFNWAVCRPHHGGWFKQASIRVWVLVHHRTTETALWGYDVVLTVMECLVIGSYKRSGFLDTHVLKLDLIVIHLFDALVKEYLSAFAVSAVFSFVDVAFCVLQHLRSPC